MKRSNAVSSSRRKSRKAHFTAPNLKRRKIMSTRLAKDLREKYNVKAVPIRTGDAVVVLRGHSHDREGRVQSVFRKRWKVYVDRLTVEKASGRTAHVGLHPSKLIITKLHMDKFRERLLKRKAEGRTKALAALNAPRPGQAAADVTMVE